MTRYFYTALFLIFSLTAGSQIIITESDMPAAGDTIRVSSAQSPGLQYAATGTDTTWDFSSLFATSQKLILFEDINDLPFAYQAAFNSPLDPEHKAEYAIIDSDSLPIPNLNVTKFRQFFRKTSTEYGVVGYGAEVNGFHIPGKYDSLDLHYSFPVSYGDSSGSHSIATQQIPSLGFFQREVSRKNVVDGWGTVITPYGTFSVLRVKSEVVQKDSIKFDSVPAFPAMHAYITEYKWLTKNKGLPVLKVVMSNGYPQVVEYLDSMRSFTSVAELEQPRAAVYPNPSGGEVIIAWNTPAGELKIYDLSGRLVLSHDVSDKRKIVIPPGKISAAGMYLVILEGDGIIIREKLVKK